MTFESSPRTRTKPKRSSTLRFSSEEISLTDSGAALSPGLAFATSPAELSSAKGEVSGMNILLLGSGGREHALAWKLAQSRLCDKLYAAPGNPGIGEAAELVALDATDHAAVIAFCEAQRIGLVVVGPEAPLVDGLADSLRAAGFAVFGPSRAAVARSSSSRAPAAHPSPRR